MLTATHKLDGILGEQTMIRLRVLVLYCGIQSINVLLTLTLFECSIQYRLQFVGINHRISSG